MISETKKKDKRMFTLFIVIVLSLLIAMTRAIETTLVAVSFQIVLIFAQSIIVKNLIDSFMGSGDD
jgi:hypothetical protein